MFTCGISSTGSQQVLRMEVQRELKSGRVCPIAGVEFSLGTKKLHTPKCKHTCTYNRSVGPVLATGPAVPFHMFHIRA
jgi:hypothetical protein